MSQQPTTKVMAPDPAAVAKEQEEETSRKRQNQSEKETTTNLVFYCRHCYNDRFFQQVLLYSSDLLLLRQYSSFSTTMGSLLDSAVSAKNEIELHYIQDAYRIFSLHCLFGNTSCCIQSSVAASRD
jgi:hypothetical protein